MPSPSPNKAIEKFCRAVDEHTAQFNALTSVVGESNGAQGFTALKLRRVLATDYFFRVATDWQWFQHDWTIRAIAHLPQALITNYEQQMRSTLEKTKIPDTLSLFTETQVAIPILPRALRYGQVKRILDPSGRNLEFSTSEAWRKFAVKYLQDPHKRTLLTALTPEEETFLDTVRLLRNAIAHRSTTSMGTIQTSLQMRPDDGDYGLVGDANRILSVDRKHAINDLGTYLDRLLPNRYTPAMQIAERLQEFAEKLEWSPTN